jgi:hypothetical protein
VKTARGWSVFALPGYQRTSSAIHPEAVYTKTVDFAVMAEDAKNVLEVRATLAREPAPGCDGEECVDINARWLCTDEGTQMRCEERPWREASASRSARTD